MTQPAPNIRPRRTALRMGVYTALAIGLGVSLWAHPRTNEIWCYVNWQRAPLSEKRDWWEKLRSACRNPKRWQRYLAMQDEVNGFYAVSSDPNAPEVRISATNFNSISPQRRLGEQISSPLKNTRAWANNNQNSSFDFSFETNADFVCFIRINDLFYEILPTKGGFARITIDSPESAESLARMLGIELFKRRDPGPVIKAEFVRVSAAELEADRQTKKRFTHPETDADVLEGRPQVWVWFRMTNVSDKPIFFLQGGKNRGPRDNQFSFTATRNGLSHPDTGSKECFGGIASIRTIQPGDCYGQAVDLGRWFDFSEPGRYHIEGAYDLNLYGDNNLDSFFDVIWEDKARAAIDIEVP